MDSQAHITLFLDGDLPGIREQKINYTELKQVLDALEVFVRRCYARVRTQDHITELITPDSTINVVFGDAVSGSLGIPVSLIPAKGQSPSLFQDLAAEEFGRVFEGRLSQNTSDTEKLKEAIQRKKLNASFTVSNDVSTAERVTIDTTVRMPARPFSGVIHGTITALYFDKPAFDIVPDGQGQKSIRVYCTEAERDALRRDFVSHVSVMYKSSESKRVLLRILSKEAFSSATMEESSEKSKTRWVHALRILGSS